MNLKTFFIATGILLSVNSYAARKTESDWSTKLTTPALWPIAPDTFTCSLTNVSTTDHMVQIRIINGEGVTLKESKISLGAKHTAGLDNVGLPEGGYMYCEFTVNEHKEWYRGVAKLYHANNGGDFVAVAAE